MPEVIGRIQDWPLHFLNNSLCFGTDRESSGKKETRSAEVSQVNCLTLCKDQGRGSKLLFSHLSFQSSVGMDYTATEDVQALWESFIHAEIVWKIPGFQGNGLNSEVGEGPKI